VSNKEMSHMYYYSICLQLSEQRNRQIFGLPSFKLHSFQKTWCNFEYRWI